MSRIVLGAGALNWTRVERIDDRYGTVWLMAEPKPDCERWMPLNQQPAGEYGRLVAEVLATRPSYHIGDAFRQLKPSTPKVGDRIVLGEGVAFFEVQHGIQVVGLKPLDGRRRDWLHPHQLYRVHFQSVRLVFEPAAPMPAVSDN